MFYVIIKRRKCEISIKKNFPQDKTTKYIRNIMKIFGDNKFVILKIEESLIDQERMGISSKSKISGVISTAKILTCSRNSVAAWLNGKYPMDPNTFRKIEQRLEMFSDYPIMYNALKNEGKILHNSLEKGDSDKILEIFSEFIEFPRVGPRGQRLAGLDWLSREIFEKGDSYIKDFNRIRPRSQNSEVDGVLYEQTRRYTELLTRIYLLNPNNGLTFKNEKTPEDLQVRFHKEIFKLMQDKGLINDIPNIEERRWVKRFNRGAISKDNRELFDITIHSLVALSKAGRVRYNDPHFVYLLNDLSQVFSSKDSAESRNLLTKKLRKGHPLLGAQGRRLVSYLRKNFHDAPQELHDVIYETRKHIASRQWYWQKYDVHFTDLYTPQIKDMLDLTLGLNLFADSFLPDADEKVTKRGYIIKGKYTMPVLRHHTEFDVGYLIMEKDKSTGKIKFKLIPLDNIAHKDIIHDINDPKSNYHADLLNTRAAHLYEVINRPLSQGVTYEEFKNKVVTINGEDVNVWSGYSKKTIDKWIVRWKDKDSLYSTHYKNFYNRYYRPTMRDFELFKAKNPKCRYPEFWFWYDSQYLGEKFW